jgi:hypothetical protein
MTSILESRLLKTGSSVTAANLSDIHTVCGGEWNSHSI